MSGRESSTVSLGGAPAGPAIGRPEERSTDPGTGPTSPDAPPTEVALPPEPPVERRRVPSALAFRYEDIQFVGEGGMGAVYRARDPKLGRLVALKILKGDDRDFGRRFIAEARAQARIQHDHVCPVYDAGQADGEPYIVMQYVDGAPLWKVAERWTAEQCAKAVCEVATAVHEAHRLGMIHRDIKPGNVLVERCPDGTWKPYIMDFGLARDVTEKGDTQTGTVLGTPAFMPPEQARGDVRAMDRRSDVYSLGATLYDVIAGRPPFVAEHSWKLLLMVVHEEPPSLGEVKSGVHRDLETIVMKCLEREPSRRYDSARALAEDLQRFLDGEPIQGRRASATSILWKKAKKHRLATGLVAVMILAGLTVSVAWARAGRRAAEQARLAQALGEDVKEMELFLRNAHGMPLHDVERERDVVRGRLADIRKRMAEAGEVGEGPGLHALGRGALALGDPESARLHLEKARATGYSSPDLEYALGRAIAEQFRRALAETRRITGAEARAKKVAELEVALRDPALSHLRAAVAGKIESPAYAEGLIALQEGRNEEALEKGREALDRAPWMYEAKKLQGDALFAMGNRFAHDAAFDHERMTSYFEPAAQAYAEAAEAARSDPDTHRAECELRERMGWAAAAKALPAMPAFDSAVAACTRAVRASSADARARVQLALVLSARFSAGADDGSSAPSDEELMVRAADEAVRSAPDDAMAHYAAARARLYQAERRHHAGEAVSMTPAIASYRKVVQLDPLFTWAWNELGHAHLLSAEAEILAGQNAGSALSEAERCFDRATTLDPAFSLAAQYRLRVLAARLDEEITRGESSDASVDALGDAVRSLEARMAAGEWLIVFWKAKVHVLRARHELASGRSPLASTEAARAVIRAFVGASKGDAWLLTKVVESLLLEAEHAHREGLSARAPLDEAQSVARDIEGDDAATGELRTRIALLALRDNSHRAGVKAGTFEDALAPLRRTLEKGTTSPHPYLLAAEVLSEQARWLTRTGRDPAPIIAAGLERAGEALSRNPHLAAAFATRGSLFAALAGAAREPAARAAAAQRSREAFEAARQANPRLRVDAATQ